MLYGLRPDRIATLSAAVLEFLAEPERETG
jgi:hypothetical protein